MKAKKGVFQVKREENRKYIKAGITAAAVLSTGILFAFFLLRIQGIFSGMQVIVGILNPFLYGAVIAYLLAPLCNKLEEKLYQKFPKAGKRGKRLLSFLAIIVSLIVALALVWLLVMLIIPQVWDSAVKIIAFLPDKLKVANHWVDTHLQNNPELQSYFDELSKQVEKHLNALLGSDMFQVIQEIITKLSDQIIGVLNVLKNLILGFLISAYLLGSRKLFAAQARLILHGIFPDTWARRIEEEVCYADRMFNGFFVGKIIDSAIIGAICFVGTTLLGFESAAFISVVVGLTNIIPFFGPFIGAIPCALLLLLDNPFHCIYFLIFILALQQLDGNVIGPKVLGNTTGVSSFWVLFAILLFGGLWGIVGMVIGVPLFAVIYDIIRKLIYRGLKKHRHVEMIEEYERQYHENPQKENLK